VFYEVGRVPRMPNNIIKATNCSEAADSLACLRIVPVDALSSVLNSSATAPVPAWGGQFDNDYVSWREQRCLPCYTVSPPGNIA
jgi:hypothetical protein